LAVLQITILLMVAIAGTAVVLTRDPTSQTIGLSFFGLLLALMFFIFQAPDVALSQIVIGAVALPLMFLLTLAKVRLNSDIAELADKRRQKQNKSGKEVA
jgi:energy-converting hydrogenase B subunit D